MNNIHEITEPPLTLHPYLKPMWRYWNLGSYAYFKKSKTVGKAMLDPWVMTEEKANFEALKAKLSSSAAGRWVPEGNYVRLLKKQKSVYTDEIYHGEVVWETVMSDTPDEMNDHLLPIIEARGRVLINGLGLGCVLNCIRTQDSVTHVDVVEVSEDVLELVAPFFENDKRIEFHLGSCVDIKWPRGTRWNYAWHDIWSSISVNNLVDDNEAEHGISYARLHRMFGHRVDAQNSWAFERAQQVRTVNKIQEQMAEAWATEWNRKTQPERVEMMIKGTVNKETPEELWRQFLNTIGEEIKERMEVRAYREMTPDEAGVIIGDQTRWLAMKKVGMIT
jgi:hypothetical protein